MDMSFPWLVLVLLCHARQIVNSLNDEGVALRSFKESINEDPGNFLGNWNFSDPIPCSWNGITCRHGKVVSLAITNKGLAGILPSVLGNLASIRHLNLRNNKLSGILPVWLFEVRGMRSLVLSGNRFSGAVPREIENLSALLVLDLSRNSFNGTTPSSVLQCKRLTILDLSHNNFSGSLPDGLGTSLIALQTLNLSFNKLDGMIPGDIGNLSNLKEKLDLSHNSFHGPIPESLGNIPENVYIDLSYNNLSGVIPPYDVLLNLGPTAFIGNPFLCGPPLKLACPSGIRNPFSTSLPHFPSPDPDNNSYSGKRSRNPSRGVIIMIISIGMIGSCLLGWLLSYNCRRSSCKTSEHAGSCMFDEKAFFKKELFCFRNAVLDKSPENTEQYNFVPLDMEVNFNLDKLLKASAFLLGKTSNGIVYKVVLEDGQCLAVRRLGEGGSPRQKDFQTEVEAIGKIRHPNIVRLRAYCWSVDEKLLIYDFIPNGDLASALHGKSGFTPSIPLSWTTRLRIMKGIAKGLVYLHEISPKKYVHGDLKPSSVLLGENMEPQISNFGLGRLADVAGCSSSSFQLDQLVMTTPEQQTSPYELTAINTVENMRSYYQAPEALRASKPSQKWDIYSLGMILLEMITGKLPVVEVGSFKFDLIRWLQVSIEEGIPLRDIVDPSLLHDLDKEEEMAAVLKIGLACVHKNPEKRPSTRHMWNSMDKLIRLSIEV